MVGLFVRWADAHVSRLLLTEPISVAEALARARAAYRRQYQRQPPAIAAARVERHGVLVRRLSDDELAG
jgi:DNA-binding response OmpR family regulator